MRFSGFIFDFDGLIVDTEMPRYNAWREVYESYGVALPLRDWWIAIGTGPAVFDPGRNLHELSKGKADSEKTHRTADKRSDELMESAELYPGVADFIQAAFEAKMPMAVASSSNRGWVIGHLERFDLLRYFQSVFTAENVVNVKPDPELYVMAARKLGLPIDQLLAFEDSPNGIKAAKAAGLHCVAVPNIITREMDLSQADWIVDSFARLHPTAQYPDLG
jgi:HAD superfamily hydrolase (TIGR01509 family)